MFGFNPLNFSSIYNPSVLADVDQLVDIAPQPTSQTVEAIVALEDYFTEAGVKSVLFYASYLPADDVTSIKFTFSVGYEADSLDSNTKFIIQYFDGTNEHSYMLTGKNSESDVNDKIEVTYSGNVALCKMVVRRIN